MPQIEAIFTYIGSHFPLRPWNEFLDFSRFKATKQNKLPDRFRTNLHYFAMNYLITYLLFCFYALVAQPLLFLVILVAIGIYGFLFIVRQEPIVIGNTVITNEQKLGGLLLGTTLAAFIVAGLTLIICFTLATVITVFHATLRSRSVKARVSTFIDEVKVATGIQVISDGGVGYDEEKGGGGNMTVDEMERSQAVRAQTEQHRQTREKMRQKYFVDRSTNN